jgi:serine protease Do
MENMSNKIYKWGAIVLLAVGIVSWGTSAQGLNIKLSSIKPVATQTTNSATLTDEQQGILAVRTAKVAVVNIVGSASLNTLQNNPFGAQQTSGTGFVIDSNGYIVSNSHVVADQNETYNVIFSDGSSYPATVVGMDTYSDVAVLKINKTGLTAAKLGNSDSLETGQTVFAIGNSLGRYQNTVTKGVVSGLSRSVSLGTPNNPQPRMQNLIQTDAAINPGNSGGPLINMNAEVVGVNTLIDTTGQGIGFSIPINVVKSIADQLRANGKVSHPYLGINFQTIDKTLQAIKQLPVSDGAYVATVVSGGPAAKAGMLAGDIITKLEGQAINATNELDVFLQRYPAGKQVTLTILRNGQTLELPVVLGVYQQ